MMKPAASAYLIAAILLSIGGIAAFVYLFLDHINIYWIVLSPVILVVYQLPAFFLFKTYLKKSRHTDE